MDRSSAVQQLPAMHAVAIRLRDDGHGDHVIAVALEIDDDQVPTLLQIADSKLENLMALDLVSRTGCIDRPQTLQARQPIQPRQPNQPNQPNQHGGSS